MVDVVMILQSWNNVFNSFLASASMSLEMLFVWVVCDLSLTFLCVFQF